VTALGVLLVDDHVVVRAGLSALIEGEPDLEVVGEAGDGPTASHRDATRVPHDA
jgi:DNA-binding NarL/FixJ family response regulator